MENSIDLNEIKSDNFNIIKPNNFNVIKPENFNVIKPEISSEKPIKILYCTRGPNCKNKDTCQYCHDPKPLKLKFCKYGKKCQTKDCPYNHKFKTGRIEHKTYERLEAVAKNLGMIFNIKEPLLKDLVSLYKQKLNDLQLDIFVSKLTVDFEKVSLIKMLLRLI